MENEERLSEAIKLYDVKQFDKALPVIRKLAKKNDPLANYYLGMMSLNGLGMKKDVDIAYDAFNKSALELEPASIYMMGICHLNGWGVSKNETKAFEYFQSAAERKYHEALLKVAECYEIGLGISKNETKALKIYAELAKNEDAFSAYKIGVAYLEGKGVPKSPESAFTWLNKALSYGSIDAMNRFRLIGTKSKTDARTTQMMFSIGEELLLSDHPKDAIIYLEIASNEGHLSAYQNLVKAYDQGIGVLKDAKKSFDYCLKAAELGDGYMAYRLAEKYEQGDGVDSSFVKAAKWYEIAKNLHHEPAVQALNSLRGYNA